MKKYRIRLWVGSIDLGVYEVHADNEQNAYEMAWDLASMRFQTEVVEETDK